MKHTYFIEVTDTFCGELNYSWLSRFRVKANSERGAMRVIGREYGYNMRNDGINWRFKHACIAAYCVENVNPDNIVRYVELN